ncbi:hypothetical protein IKG45_02810 [Candidatus Saccharibacteria bacterium]|nr:hypothetical protein [Candidatus Saccharibacteria bacterium]
MIEKVENPGSEKFSPARKFGHLLRERIEKDPRFYLFSPDETTSNRLDEVFEVATRAWATKKEGFDLPESESGRVIELLSENTLFAVMIGHIMNGEQAMMTSYEAFFSVILSQIVQQIKFFKQSDNVPSRPKYPAVNLLSTSTCFRQDHNGFSHQSPVMISALLSIPSNKVNCLFPVDDVSVEKTFDFMLKSENVVNFTTFDKNDNPRWIDSYHAQFLFDNGGASVYRFASDNDPDVVLTAIGDIVTRETLFARDILKKDMPELKIRFVGINALSYNAIGTTDNKLNKNVFDEYFTKDKLIVANFHGYPETLKHILGQYTNEARISVHGFSEEGSTTTPFEMLALNHVSRFDIAMDVAEKFGRFDLKEKYLAEISKNHENALKTGLDLF